MYHGLLSEQSNLNILGGFLIAFCIGEKVSVDIIGHLDRRMAHELLNALRVHAVLNPQGSAGVAEGVHPVLRTARAADHASGHLNRSKAVFDYVGVRFDLAAAIWENETEITLGANKRPLAESIENHRGQGSGAVSCLGF